MNDSPVATDPMIAAITNPALSPLFWRPARLGVESAWYGHVPFAHWLVAAHRPASIVELGAHNGVSYAAFCEAVLREQIDARCLAVDSWQGDQHAGFYGEEVLADLRRFHDQRYAGFSTLFRGYFDEALNAVPDGSVDLLHIDGRHLLADVRHDFETWRVKLSPRGVVLFHDTNVREHDFGVWRLWADISRAYPSFEFLHGHGLGVLACGPQISGAVASLCALSSGRDVNAVRERFATLGERWIAARDLLDQSQARAKLAGELQSTKQWAETAQGEMNKLWPVHAALVQTTQQTRAALAEARHAIAARDHELGMLRQGAGDNGGPQARIAALERYAEDLKAAAHAQISALQAQRRAVLQSASWRLTGPLRRLMGLRRGAAAAPDDTVTLPSLPPAAMAPSAQAVLAQDRPGAPTAKRALFISGEPHTPGNTYRVERYVAAARALGYDARWMAAEPVGPDDLLDLQVAILWRVPHGQHVAGIIELCRARGTLVVFDVDDLMFRPELAVIDIIDGIRSQNFSELQTSAFFAMIGRTLKAADIVSCPTAELAHEARLLGRPACVMPNGFDDAGHATARRARAEWARTGDDLLRIGYAGGSRTHQRDFAVAAPAIAAVLRENPQARLVIFRDPSSGEGLVLMGEFAEFADMADRIEWRDMVPLAQLPTEMARFAVNIAPLEADNPFCEAKSELKYFEAALAGVPTIASPAGPFRRAIIQGVTGFLATTTEEWHAALSRLLNDAALRARMAQAAYHDALAHFSPYAQMQAFSLMLGQASGGLAGAAAFERAQYRAALPRLQPPHVPASDIVWQTSNTTREDAAITVVVPVFKYADMVGEALSSVAAQTLQALDLVIIDDASPDDSSDMVLLWLKSHAGRFNRATLLRHRENAGLGFARNSGFATAETPFILPLDADNRLLPEACSNLLAALADTCAAFAYPAIRQFGDKSEIFGTERYSVLALQQGNYIDAMALVRKTAWAAVGGYDHVRYGWEDYDFWCRLAERGHFGVSVPNVLAEYRVHGGSMLHTMTEVFDHRQNLVEDMRRRHPWLDLRQQRKK
jgi:glycosyltransferase involved in cell wall biosynthesis/GT2 family glycosyltransferase